MGIAHVASQVFPTPVTDFRPNFVISLSDFIQVFADFPKLPIGLDKIAE
jgi:hypothetical protein